MTTAGAYHLFFFNFIRRKNGSIKPLFEHITIFQAIFALFLFFIICLANNIFSFPFTNKGTDVKTIKMGEIQRRAIKAFEYSGEGRSGIELFLYFSGGVTGVITVTNETTSQKILIDTSLLPNGYLLKNGDRIRILTYSGDKQVRLWKYDKENEKYLTYNILNCIGSGSDWLEVINGSNSITVSAENGGDNIDVTVITTVKYEGL